MKKKPRIYLEQPQKILKTQTYKMLKRVKIKLEMHCSGTFT